jgi:hypothetical protein
MAAVNVRFTPESRHSLRQPECPRWANSARRSEGSTLSLLKYNYRLVVTNNPREASARVNCWITLSVFVKFLAFSMSRRSAFNAGSLSLLSPIGTQKACYSDSLAGAG